MSFQVEAPLQGSFHAIVKAKSGLSNIITQEDEGSGSASFMASEADGTIIRTAHAARRTEWLPTAALIIADVVGTGVLSLPGAFASLGMALGITVTLVCYPLNFFTGYQLNKVHMQDQTAVTFGDAATAFIGPAAGYVMYGSLYFYLLLLLGDYFITLSKAIQSIFWSVELCRPVAGLITAVLLIPTNQFRSLNGLTLLSAMSFATVVVVLIIYLVTIVTKEGVDGGDVKCSQDTIPDRGTGFDAILSFAGSLSKFIFAFSGQKIFLEMQAEMREPQKFPRAMNVGLPVLAGVFLLLSVVTFQRCGDSTPHYILDALEYDWTRTFANILMFAHLIVSYTISQQVLARAISIFALPEALGTTSKSRLMWFALTSFQMVVGFTLANLIPLFGDFVSLMGSLLSTQMTFSFPTALYLGARRRFGPLVPAGAPDTMMFVISILVLLISAFFTVIGTISAMKNILADAASGAGSPFGCHCIAKICIEGPEM